MTKTQAKNEEFLYKLQTDIDVFSSANTILNKLKLTNLLDPITYLFKNVIENEIIFLVKGKLNRVKGKKEDQTKSQYN